MQVISFVSIRPRVLKLLVVVSLNLIVDFSRIGCCFSSNK